MEKRRSPDRRQEHMFVSKDRRVGPFDRRDSTDRREEILSEREKIERIRAFKAKDQAVSSQAPLFTKKRLILLGAALLLLIAVLYLSP